MMSFKDIKTFEKLDDAIERWSDIESCLIVERTDSTVIVEYNLTRVDSIKAELRIITMQDIKKLIDNNQDIDLNCCYIYDFDIKVLKNEEGIFPTLKNFSAQYTYFDGKVNFSKAIFGEGNIIFYTAYFAGKYLSFRETKFGDGNIIFDRSHFGEASPNFMGVLFKKGHISFNRCIFSSDIYFFACGFEDNRIDFNYSTFHSGDIIFIGAITNNVSVYFDEVNAVNSKCEFQGYRFINEQYFNFRKLKSLKIYNCVVDDILLINNSRISGVEIEQLSFLDTRNIGNILVDWKLANKAIQHFANEENIESSIFYNQKADQMKMLKENYHNLGEYEWEDEAFVEYMRYKRKSRNTLMRFPSWLLDIIAGYGTRPLRLFFTMIVTIVLFAILFSDLVGLTEIGIKTEITQDCYGLFQGLYFSIITFLTIGYGDISPMNTLTAFLAGMEGFLGLFLMSYFTVSIVRKTLR